MAARDIMESALRRELFGPPDGEAPRGKPLDLTPGLLSFSSWDQARGPWHDAATGQEILSEVEPLRRYGVGVLHPAGEPGEDAALAGITGLPVDAAIEDGGDAPQFQLASSPEADGDDFDLSDANSFKPRAMAVSMKVRVGPGSRLQVQASAAAYEAVAVKVDGSRSDRTWWVRRPFHMLADVGEAVLLAGTPRVAAVPAESDCPTKVRPQLQVYSRPVPGERDPRVRLVTVALVNTTQSAGSGAAVYQAAFEVRPQGAAQITPYPEPSLPGGIEEEASIALLYRKQLTYAVGHGCAADWDEPAAEVTAAVRAEPLPAYEVPSLTADIRYESSPGQLETLRVSMEALAAEDPSEGRRQVELVLGLYEKWIAERKQEVALLEPRHQEAGRRHMRLCEEALDRMRHGWRLVNTDELAARAFRLANEAMLQQQLRSRLPVREVSLDRSGFIKIAGGHPDPAAGPGVGDWRPFQIAFLLASLPEIVDRQDAQRGTVDLIFFPTGGGKTEAYLGAAALSMLARRLRDPQDAGTDVLMRYTLRLLTAQQFLRAAALTCVLDSIREREKDLGEEPFSIGIWLGSSTTPNTWSKAVSAWSALQRSGREENPFLLLRCPWCGTRMGPVPAPGGRGRQHIAGYEKVGSKVKFRCPDTACRFSGRQGLPVAVVDEDIYERRPTLVIGTVDKFAMLAWQPRARALFGIGDSGQRVATPPGLVIQDELHLISGPLGSMVGLYEPVIEALCTDDRGAAPVPPKIIASTATIRRYEKQIRDLYGRSSVALFPPHGIEEGRSFFAEPAVRPDGTPEPGRRYLGVNSPSLGSIQTVQVRVAAATLQGATAIPEQDRDAYWTNLNFLNSLRELGNTVSLLQSDIPDYMTGLRKRDGIDPAEVRWPRNTLELTSRRRSDEIPKAIEELQQEYGQDGCVDICLASNIIEVGVDIDRLSLMTIVGQPKTTAQYIQVSGRVGRKWWQRPGLIVTIYGAAKPRDRSHYERFRSYHQRLYAQVEPTSLTPFALPVVRRGLHGALVAYIRQTSTADLPAYPFPQAMFAEALDVLEARGAATGEPDLKPLQAAARRRAAEWQHWERTEWSANPIGGGDPKQGLMRFPGSTVEPGTKVPVWEVPTSMRNVDAECQLRITNAYAVEAVNEQENQA